MNPTSPPTTAQIEFDGQWIALPQGLTLAALLTQRGVDGTAVATAVNQRFVARALRATTLLQPGDQITTFEAITGG